MASLSSSAQMVFPSRAQPARLVRCRHASVLPLSAVVVAAAVVVFSFSRVYNNFVRDVNCCVLFRTLHNIRRLNFDDVLFEYVTKNSLDFLGDFTLVSHL